MFTKKSNYLHWKRWIPLTILNIIQIPLFFENSELLAVILFMIGIFINQYMLFIVGADITGIKKNLSLLPTWFYALSKFLILVLTISFAMSYTTGKELIILEMYIFQLIILVLSIKRVVKKN